MNHIQHKMNPRQTKNPLLEKKDVSDETPKVNHLELMKKLEKEGEAKLLHAYVTGEIVDIPTSPNESTAAAQHNINCLNHIMETGMEEFKEKTGRPMTYAEMRSVYG